ncbi:hypothetical protein RA267_30105, partial [Pseudomonas syringae pv. tagetis]|uniref:hypothetical protein n=1 Tax=Pseudomonas syringae group genomosp. 7 TaxID=251699 RepID=UPI00376F7C1C
IIRGCARVGGLVLLFWVSHYGARGRDLVGVSSMNVLELGWVGHGWFWCLFLRWALLWGFWGWCWAEARGWPWAWGG